jgi:hypothetical protein
MKIVKYVLLSLVFVSAAHADRRGSDAREFMAELKNFVQTCTMSGCEAPNEIKKIYSANDGIVLASDSFSQFKQIAWEQAQVWGDTILEGDYQAAGDTRLDAVFALYRGEKLLGYRITYSEKAWSTSECAYDGKNTKSLNQCPVGRIVESSFVSSSLKTYVTDQNQFAEFQSNQ